MTKELGVLDQAIEEIISLLKTDTGLGILPTYSSMWEVTTNTQKPCQSVDLATEKNDLEGGYSGGCVDEYSCTGFIIQYLPPDHPKDKIRSQLDEYRERTRNIIRESTTNDIFEVLTSWNYVESKPLPWTVQAMNGPKILAHRMITDFTATYSVKEEV